MRKIIVLAVLLCLCLCGCSSLMDGSYNNKTPHQAQEGETSQDSVYASNYSGLCKALSNLIKSGTQSSIIYVSRYNQSAIEADMRKAVEQTKQEDPIAAYAVDTIEWKLGTSSGQSAVAVTVNYIHDRTEIMKIRTVADLEVARTVIAAELAECSTGVVLYVQSYEKVDFAQLVEDYGLERPQMVMEIPRVTANVYPEEGKSRVVELKFYYQTSRDSLRSMQDQVSPVFRSAALYVSGDAQEQEKFSQLYSFLMERYDYKVETSITPAYSLLRHGVGDSRAFATVYAAMCREAGLDCRVISGTCQGESWYWNLICVDGQYYHLDLLRSNTIGGMTLCWDADMQGYVWDYSAYPESLPPVQETPDTTGTEPTETTVVTDETEE